MSSERLLTPVVVWLFVALIYGITIIVGFDHPIWVHIYVLLGQAGISILLYRRMKKIERNE